MRPRRTTVPCRRLCSWGTNHNNTTDGSQLANQVVMYRRADDGRLRLVGRSDTDGQGSGPSQRFAGDGLGAGNSVRLSTNGRLLFVTNAGSNSVSSFHVARNGLQLPDVASTGNGGRVPRQEFETTWRVQGWGSGRRLRSPPGAIGAGGRTARSGSLGQA